MSVGGPYNVYSPGEEWITGHNYGPGALVHYKNRLYLATNYNLGLTTPPDQDSANWSGESGYTGATAVTFAASMSLDASSGGTFTVGTLNATNSGAGTLNLAAVPPSGDVFRVIVTADNALNVLTFGTNFKSTGTVIPGSGKFLVVEFVSNGSAAIEVARTSAGV